MAMAKDQAPADRKTVQTKQVMLTPADVKAIQRALPEKATAIIAALRGAGLIGGEKKPAGDRGPVSPLGGQAA